MNKIFVLVGVLIVTACSKNDQTNRCNFLPNISVNRSINLSLPEYSPLQFTGNTVYIVNEGVAGIYLSRTGNQFRAFDAADPSHQFNPSCSLLVQDGGIGTCGCEDENSYSLATGLPFNSDVSCTMWEYRVDVDASNNTLIISNY